MNRKEFLKMVGLATAGSAFTVNGFSATVVNHLFTLPPSCADVNDRILVIIRMSGANDALNMAIPISQYDTYANLRPNLKISNTGLNAYIPLDNTLPDNKKTGLHPTMTGFKNLYDSGKLTLIPGVGYPSPNYSHFQSQNTMFSGKDGNTNRDLLDGIFGNYLATSYPGLSGRPTTKNPDPLAIQIGSSNPCLFYGNIQEKSIEYNISSFEETLASALKTKALPAVSEYTDLVKYINDIERGLDVYYARVNAMFAAGSNSTVVYPKTGLATQLKTVARIIKGGSKTKIFQVNLGGFDNHVNQAVSGSSHTGAHANLLKELSDAAKAFQDDLQSLGLADKVMTVSFSEFGRRVKENGNLGTDHGDISSFFVLGNAVQAGVLNTHPLFSNATDLFYNQNQRKTDYREIYKTIMQDWLGASDLVIQNTGLSSFNKIPIINTAANASPACLISVIASCDETIVAVAQTTVDNWTYYSAGPTEPIVFGIEHIPTNFDGNNRNFTAEVTLYKQCAGDGGYSTTNNSNKDGIFVAGYHWNIRLLSGSVGGLVNLRFFPDAVKNTEIEIAANDFATATNADFESPLIYFRTSTPLSLPTAIRADGKGLKQQFFLLSLRETGFYSGRDYVQFNRVRNLDQVGGGAMKLVTNATESTFADPLLIKGTLRYNNVLHRFEGYDGADWSPLH